MLILLPSSLITCSVLSLSPRFFSLAFSITQDQIPLSRYTLGTLISSPYSQVLCLFTFNTRIHLHRLPRVQSPFPFMYPSDVSPLPLIFFPFIHNSCVMSVAVGFLRAVASSLRRILSALQFSCPYNYVFFCQTTLVPYSNSQLFSFINSVTTFERLQGRRMCLPGPLFSTLIDVTYRLETILVLIKEKNL